MEATARIGFAGTPAFARALLQALIEGGYPPVVVYSQPDRPKGRGRKMIASPVKALALDNKIPVQTPRTLKAADAQEVFCAHDLDLFIVAAYGLILPPPILAAPRLGCLNVHASLLPRWRGAAPIERAIIAGDKQTGVALMQMEAGLDTGPVYRSVTTPISDHTTAGDLEATLAVLGAKLLLALLPEIEHVTPTPQPGSGATYADKIKSADANIDWHRPAPEIHRQIRALSERAPARSTAGDLTLQILAATPLADAAAHPPGTIVALTKKGLVIATGRGLLNITRAQINRGKGKPLTAADLANGYADLLAPGLTMAAD